MEGSSHTLFRLHMNADEPSLGRCPDCDEPIPAGRRLIEYERTDGTVAAWAECPGCADVVAPE
jgi:uncharacterized protein with PIN domain